ncbi:hypothetical protein BCR43DRAFT_499009 [Syncephalastrum racemosum]|uniref:Uncharacterized protein n=1 Tax=Syncephalastrum racemosum TaxID=13706 RepID=A0A1X2H1V3_SYNRA|nr:hypothetical protein BCR43DRAFT_499009 [Syncephalastrum racemosum]
MSTSPRKRKVSTADDPKAIARAIRSDTARGYQAAREEYSEALAQALSRASPAANPPWEEYQERDGVYAPDAKPDCKSIGTIIKHYGLRGIKCYWALEYEKKCAVLNGLNSILDLSDGSGNGQKHVLLDEWDFLQSIFAHDLKIEKFDQAVSNDMKNLAKLTRKDKAAGYKSSRMSELNAVDNELSSAFCIYADIIKLLSTRDNPMNRVKEMTEYDTIVKIWSPVFETLFRDTHVVLKWGESKLQTDEVRVPAGPEDHIFFKVDLRLILNHRGTEHTLAIVEVARYFQDSKIRHDHSKLLIESKLVLDNMLRHGCSPGDACVPSLQLCGLRGDFLVLQLEEDGLYVAAPVACLRFPSGVHRLWGLEEMLTTLRAFKSSVTQNLELLETCINETRNSFGKKFSRREPSPRPASITWQRPTWWPDHKKRRLRPPSLEVIFGKN